MAVAIYSGMAVTPGAYTKTTDLVTGQYQYIGKGKLNLYARGSAAGISISLKVNGIPLIDDQPIMYLGATGGLSQNDHLVLSQQVAGGRIELTLRNTTATAGTTADVYLTYEPTK